MSKLDLCWKNQLRLSGWVAEQEKGNVANLKTEWLKKNRFRKAQRHRCFFCQYSIDHGGEIGGRRKGTCENCPGRLVDPNLKMYWCQNRGWHWARKAKAFYQFILALDKKRRTK